ncbi:hypothetical protein D3C75_1125840 [compost metagenome]
MSVVDKLLEKSTGYGQNLLTMRSGSTNFVMKHNMKKSGDRRNETNGIVCSNGAGRLRGIVVLSGQDIGAKGHHRHS